MDSQSLTQLGEPSAEAQLRVLEIVLQIITLSILVSFAATLVIIIWLCLRELRKLRPGGPYAQVVRDENAGIPVLADPHTGNSGIQSYARAFPPWYSTWTWRIFSRTR
jgi:hypothetical protein